MDTTAIFYFIVLLMPMLFAAFLLSFMARGGSDNQQGEEIPIQVYSDDNNPFHS